MNSPADKPTLITRDAGKPCKLCGNTSGIWGVHYPEMIFRVENFEAPPWFAHDKFFCPECVFLWTDVFDNLNTADYGRKYVENNYDHQRRPTEARMAFAPLLLAKLISLTGGSRFLDYGCGYNYSYIYELRSRGFGLWGCDISPAINYSRYIRQMPFEQFPEDFFDGLYSIDVMEHFSDFINDFRNAARIVKPGGYLLFNTISLDNHLHGDETPPDDPMIWAPWHCSVFSAKSGAILANKVGLLFEGIIPTQSDTGLAFLFRKPGPFSFRRMNYLDKGWKRLKLSIYSYYFSRNYSKAKNLK